MLPNQQRVRLAGSVVKLLEEVVSDNGAANELLMADVHIDPAMKGFFSYASAEEDDRVGRTSYINLFKACVEDEVKPLAERQAEVVQLFQKYKNDLTEKLTTPCSRSRLARPTMPRRSPAGAASLTTGRQCSTSTSVSIRSSSSVRTARRRPTVCPIRRTTTASCRTMSSCLT